MGSFRVPAIDSSPLRNTLSDTPEQIKEQVKLGFATLSHLRESQLASLKDIALRSFESPTVPDLEKVSRHLDLEEDATAALMSAASFLVAMISSRRELPREVLEETAQAGLINFNDLDAAVRFGESLSDQRPHLRRIMRAKQLSGAIIPSLERLQTTLDIRLGFSDGKVDLAVPVVIAQIHTDVEMSDERFFQMDKSDVQRLVDQLQQLIVRIEEAERWIPGAEERSK